MFAFGEPQLDRAVALEEQADSAHTHGVGPHNDGRGMVELSRSTQKVGLLFATGLSGCFLGGIFGIAFAFIRGRLSAKSDWSRSLSLAAALFAGVTWGHGGQHRLPARGFLPDLRLLLAGGGGCRRVGQFPRHELAGTIWHPNSPHYSDLFRPWASDGSFPLLYSRKKVEEAEWRIVLGSKDGRSTS